MTGEEIVGALARDRRVEGIVGRIAANDPRKADLDDLAQMVYVILLEMPEDLLRDLYENGQENYYIARIVKNQYYQKRQWYREIRRPREREVPIEERNETQ